MSYAHAPGSHITLMRRTQTVPCTWCHADAGTPCTTASGQTALYPHQVRIAAANTLAAEKRNAA